MSTQIWLNQLKEQSEQDNNSQLSKEFAEQFDLTLGDQVSSLQNDLLDNNIDIKSAVDNIDLYSGDWPGFEELAKSYLNFCKNVNPNDMVESFDLYAQLLTDLTTAFVNNKGAILSTTVVNTGKSVVSMALSQDAEHSSDEMLRTSYLSSLLLKLFNSIRGEKLDPNSTGPVKKDIIMYVATALCRVYFKLGTPASCANVFSNIHTANIRFSHYPIAERVEYRYYLGRFYLMKNQLVLAFKHLRWAFDNCYAASGNKRLILVYLAPVSILLGEFPTPELLQHFQLYNIYGPLVYYAKSANYRAFMNSIEQNKQYYLSRGLYIMLKTRSLVLLHRNILYKVWKIRDKENTVPFQELTKAMSFSKGSHPDNWHLNDPEYIQLESILASLISQNMVKANIYSRNKVIRLRANQPIPPLNEVNSLQDRELYGHEKWMNN